MSIFDELEKAVYRVFCEKARDYMKEVLEQNDEEIFKTRDKKRYIVKGAHETAVKTLFGEVPYFRRRYRDRERGEDIYLLDKALGIYGVGKISNNLAQTIVAAAAQQSFRRAAQSVSSMTGQTISHAAVWNVVQALGGEVEEREDIAVRRADDNIPAGKEKTPILFEEADGVYISIQGKDRKRYKKHKQEMKVSLAYTGCKKDGKRTELIDRVAFAGFYTPDEFQKRWDAVLQRKWDISDIRLRVLNGDGAAWIKNCCVGGTVYQLDRFHIRQEIIRSIRHGHIRKRVIQLMRHNLIDECLDYIETYRNSVMGEEYDNADRLLSYLENNREGIISFKERGIKIPEPPPGVFYNNLGTMENHNYTIITQRMKNNRTSWSRAGATHMAKILTERVNGTLEETIQKYYSRNDIGMLDKLDVPSSIFTAREVPETCGSGELPKQYHMPLADAALDPGIKQILRKVKAEDYLLRQ